MKTIRSGAAIISSIALMLSAGAVSANDATDVERPVPEDLYYAVAQVIAYIFNLASVRPGAPPVQRPQPTVPPNMQFDANGKLENEEATS